MATYKIFYASNNSKPWYVGRRELGFWQQVSPNYTARKYAENWIKNKQIENDLEQKVLEFAKEKGYEDLPFETIKALYLDPQKETEYFLENKATFEQKMMYQSIVNNI